MSKQTKNVTIDGHILEDVELTKSVQIIEGAKVTTEVTYRIGAMFGFKDTVVSVTNINNLEFIDFKCSHNINGAYREKLIRHFLSHLLNDLGEFKLSHFSFNRDGIVFENTYTIVR